MERGGHVYILMNHHDTTMYIGVSSDLISRVQEHKSSPNPRSFTARYNIIKLVYYEFHSTIDQAIQREKRLKNWNRSWKEKLVKKFNADLKDMFDELCQDWGYEVQ